MLTFFLLIQNVNFDDYDSFVDIWRCIEDRQGVTERETRIGDRT